MKLLSTLATLLLALQVVAAVNSDGHQKQSGFVKVKRTVKADTAPGHKAYRLRLSVKKRSLEGLLGTYICRSTHTEVALYAKREADPIVNLL